jgi:hypothetical protein
LEVNIEDYKNTKLYKKMILSVKSLTKKSIMTTEGVTQSAVASKQFIIKVAQAFENFKNYLRDNKISIDYTYLWDLVCMPNPRLFEGGINLIILEIPEDDATNNIELVCPTNHYSVHAFDARKRSLILIKRENYFEPIYGHRNDGKNIHITKTFTEYDKKLPRTLKNVFEKIIKPTLGEKCRSFVSRPNEYRFEQPPILDKLIKKLQKKEYTISMQILNFQGKVIGVIAKNKKGLEGFIPCYPSSLTSLKNEKMCETNPEQCDYDFVYMNDNIWKPYDETLEFLKEYYDYEDPKDVNKANCYNPKYFCKVVEDELITGFLTNTNQFVPIKDPIPVSSISSEDSIKQITNNDMLIADINTLTNNDVDTKRVDFIKRIQLETNFYNVFRNTIRILFNDYSNSAKREQIKDECTKRYALYKNQLDTVIQMLHDLVNNTIVFASETTLPYNYTSINENEIHTCISQSKEKCKIKGSVCRITDDNCQLVLPKENLVNGTDNERYYYGRMADELIRYNRIKSFIFKPQAYLSFGQVKYNLQDDEIIVLQDLLNQEFFENLIPADINRYAKYNTYDTAEPILTQAYKKDIELDEIINPYHVRDCVKTAPRVISSIFWKKCFPSDYKEIGYTDSNYCSMYLIIDLVNEFKNKKITIEDIKDDLIDEYSKLTDNFKNKDKEETIIDILIEESQVDANQIQDTTMTFEQMIMQSGFTAVNFDLWLLLVRYEIPSIFISSSKIPETRFNLKEFVCYTDNSNEYVFIVTPAMNRKKNNKLQEYKYKIIINNKQNTKINLNELNIDGNGGECLTNIQNALDSYYSVKDYIEFVFKKDNKTTYNPKQKGVREIDFDIVSAPVEVIEDGEQIEIIPKQKQKVKRLKGKKIEPTLVLQEAEEAIEEKVEEAIVEKALEQPQKDFVLEDIIFKPEEQLEIIPVKKRKTRKPRLKANPPGKKGTRRNRMLPETVEIKDGNVEIVN